jgi:RHS repeat-associated protein
MGRKHIITFGICFSLLSFALTLGAQQGDRSLRKKLPAICSVIGPKVWMPLHPSAGSFPPSGGTKSQLTHRITLLTRLGSLRGDISVQTLTGWKEEAHSSKDRRRIARLTLWLGEYYLAKRQPTKAIESLQYSASLLPESNPDRGLARYDAALAEFFHGQFGESAQGFLSLLKTPLRGYNRKDALLYERHAAGCAGYHAHRAGLGIPEPPFLDPLCGVAGLGVCLRQLGMPYNKDRLEKIVGHTGEGSSMADLLIACPRLGMRGRVVQLSNTKGLIRVPMPVVAHVERDHFVAVTRADSHGVTYWCSDCGSWPGGQVRLNWAQWTSMDSDQFLAVARCNTARALALAHIPPFRQHAKKIALVDRTDSNTAVIASAQRQLAAMGSALYALPFPTLQPAICGTRGTSPQCPGFMKCSLVKPAGGCHGSVAGDPINAATGAEEYSPEPDLVVYNPNGPDVVWARIYNSLSNMVPTGFGSGWSHTYNWRFERVYGGTTTLQVDLPNGATLALTDPSHPGTGNWSVPVAPAYAGVPYYITEYGSGGSIFGYRVRFKDQSVWQFSAIYGGTQPDPPLQGNICSFYYPASITDKFGNSINLVWYQMQVLTPDPTLDSTNTPQLIQITDKLGNGLLYIAYAQDMGLTTYHITYASEYPSSSTDTGHRAVTYLCSYGPVTNPTTSGPYPTNCGELTEVGLISQATYGGATNPPGLPVAPVAQRYFFTYANYGNNGYNNQQYLEGVPYLHLIQAANPSATSTSVTPYHSAWDYGTYSKATLNYDPTTGALTSISDDNGNTTSLSDSTNTNYFGSNWSTYSTVTVTDSLGNVAKEFIVNSGSATLSPVSYQIVTNFVSGVPSYITPFTYYYQDPNDPYVPSKITDANGRSWQFQHDTYGNVTQTTAPKGTTTAYYFNNSSFAPGLLTEIAPSGQTPANLYYYSDGALETLSSPIPGDVNSGRQQSSTYTYTVLGDVKTITSPGNQSTTSHTLTFGYASTEAMAEPISLADTLGHTWTATYDERGNTASISDPLTFQTQYLYDFENNLITTTLPATGRSGPGNSKTNTFYLYPGGPVSGVQILDESGYQVSYEVNLYGNEGEVTAHEWEIGTSSSFSLDASYVYDGAYRTKTYEDGKGNATLYTFNLAGILVEIAYPEASSPAYDMVQFPTFDGVGNHLTRIDGNNLTTTYAYGDGDGLLSSVSYQSNSNLDLSLNYDAYDREISTSDGAGSSSSSFDDLGNINSAVRTYNGLSSVTFTYNYNPDNSRKSMVNPRGTWSYSYDGNGRCTSLSTPSGTSSYTYYNNDWALAWTLPNGFSSTYNYGAVGDTTLITELNAGGSQVGKFSNFLYNGAFDETQRVENLPLLGAAYTRTKSYDFERRLSADNSGYSGGSSLSFGWDAASNPSPFAGTTYTYGTDNEINGSGNYDGNGCPTSYYSQVCNYDPEARLTSYGDAFTYRSDGLRATKTAGSSKTYYYYDNGEPILETNSSGTITASNVYGPFGLESRYLTSGSTLTCYQFDPGGNVSVRSSGGSVLSNSTTTAFGGTTDSISATDPFGFGAQNGYIFDRDINLYYCQNRFYDPHHGRWLTRDPIGQGGGANTFAFCNGNPSADIDPLGLLPEEVACGIEEAADLADPAINDLGPGIGRAAGEAARNAALRIGVGAGGAGAAASGIEEGNPNGIEQAEECAAGFGQQVHNAFSQIFRNANQTAGYERYRNINTELEGPGSKLRPDAVDTVERLVYELKPNTPATIARGWTQVQKYVGRLNSGLAPGEQPYSGKVIPYNAPWNRLP